MTVFVVKRDGPRFIVADAHFGPYSAALVPTDYQFEFKSYNAARAQAEKLTKLGGKIATRMIETPDRFESVADTIYGPAWE